MRYALLILLLLALAFPASAQFVGPTTRGTVPVYAETDHDLPNATTNYSPTFGDGGSADVVLSPSDDLVLHVVMPNTGGNVDVKLEASLDGGTTFGLILFPTVFDDLDNENAVYALDLAAYYAPLYRLSFTAAGDESALAAKVYLGVVNN